MPPSYTLVRAVVWAYGRGQTDRSGVASMEQMEQLLPRTAQTTYVIRADPMRFLGDWGGG